MISEEEREEVLALGPNSGIKGTMLDGIANVRSPGLVTKGEKELIG